MRIFIGITLPDDTKAHLAHIQKELKRSCADVKWVEPHNLHLTLKFIGEFETPGIENVKRILTDVTQRHNSFYAQVLSAGAFPSINCPRVVWMGIGKGAEYIQKIAAELETGLETIGIIAENKPFSAHITLGRVKSEKNKEGLVDSLQSLIEKTLTPPTHEFAVSKLTLFKSTLTSGGPVYETVCEAILKTT
ncbi:MAG: RNA 2',3'-cyclic phosphodiesterase [Candidatus Omnitrophota bacterium]|jgi:2'-5' RNA ligase|nr:MAG: RNA 2',3'-cyclic phosphodiesterase [Candidatus Omnitrophota bacterium]